MFQTTLSVSFHAAVYLIVLSTEIRTPIPTKDRGSYQLDDREEKMFVRLPFVLTKAVYSSQNISAEQLQIYGPCQTACLQATSRGCN